MTDLWLLEVGALITILQLGAAWYAYKITRAIHSRRFWILLTAAMCWLAIRRFLDFAVEAYLIRPLSGTMAQMQTLVFPSLATICLFVGMYDLYRRMEPFDK